MMSLDVYWDGDQVGHLKRVDDGSRAYSFRYLPGASRPISLSLPIERAELTPRESEPFFEGLLPEGTLRDEIARQLRLSPLDSYGLLAALGRDCAGALQIVESNGSMEPPQIRWYTREKMERLIRELPQRPLGMRGSPDDDVRLSLAGVQRKAVLTRHVRGWFGEPLNGMPTTHILKPEPDDYPGLAANECFCMKLARRCALGAANVELMTLAGRRCLVVQRFDRDLSVSPARRWHQEDLCQALGILPDFKYQHEDRRLPSYAAFADLLDAHSVEPGLDRLTAARAAVFNFLIGNAAAHAKNISLLHVHGGVRHAPLYDLVCTSAYPALGDRLAISIGDELDPSMVGPLHWQGLAEDLRLHPVAFERMRIQLADTVHREARLLCEEAIAEGWHHDVIDSIVSTIEGRAEQVRRHP